MTALGIEEDLLNGSFTYLDSIFDDEQFFDKFIVDDETTALKAANAGMVNKGVISNFAPSIVQVIQEGGYYNFVNYYEVNDSTYHLIFRAFVNDGLNYHEYELNLDEDLNPSISDIYIYLSGTYLSDNMKMIYLPMIENIKEGKPDLQMLSDLKKMVEINENVRDKKFKEAKQLFYQLPDTLINSTLGYSMEIQLLQPEDSIRYEELVEQMSMNSNSAAAFYLSSIDRLLFEGDIVGAMECVDSLASYTGDDFLDLHRGNLHYMGQDSDSAIECFKRLLENYPFLPEAYDNLFTIYNLEQKYDEIVALIDPLMINLEATPEDVHEIMIDSYPILSDHPSYIAWKSKHNLE